VPKSNSIALLVWFWKSSGLCKIVARMDKFRKIALLGVILWVW